MLHSLSFLNLGTAIFGFLVSGSLIFSAKENRFVNFILGISFFAVAYRSLSVFALEADIVENTFFMGSVSFIYYLIPPGFYLYFRAVCYDEQSLKKSDWLHFLAPVLSVLLLVYYLVAGWIISGQPGLPVNNDVYNNQSDLPLYIQPGEHAIFIFVLAIIYNILSWKIVLLKLTGKNPKHPQLIKMRSWILTLLITCTLLLMVVFYAAIIKIIFNRDFIPFVNPHIFRSLLLIFIFSRILIKRDLLYGIPDLKTQLPVVDVVHAQVASDEPGSVSDSQLTESVRGISEVEETKVERELYFDKFGWIHYLDDGNVMTFKDKGPGSIEKDKVISYIRSINKYLETAPYIDPEFDIKSISGELNSPLYHIEYLFRYYNKYSFSEFRNTMRVKYVLDNFDKGQMKNYTLEAIGLKAGFSSRSSFFRVFKSVTGNTPKQILDTMLKN